MEHKLPDLPYPKDSLAPHMSAETLEYHYGKHHQAYVDKLNEGIKGTKFENRSLEDIIRKSEGAIFNNAAQVWNHTFFWNCLSPEGGGRPQGQVLDLLAKNFGTYDKFRDQFTTVASGVFGSGWTWLVKRPSGALAIVPKGNAGCPLTDGDIPLLTVDIWEHAYYIDYRNARPKFLAAFWHLVNWDFVAKNLSK